MTSRMLPACHAACRTTCKRATWQATHDAPLGETLRTTPLGPPAARPRGRYFHHALYINAVRECYEAYVIWNFFFFLVQCTTVTATAPPPRADRTQRATPHVCILGVACHAACHSNTP